MQIIFFVFLLFFSNIAYTNFETNLFITSELSTTYLDALYEYSLGNYRRSNKILANKNKLNDFELYLKARNFYELKDYTLSYYYFSLINPTNLIITYNIANYETFLLENYAYFYTLTITLLNISLSTKIKTINNLLTIINTYNSNSSYKYFIFEKNMFNLLSIANYGAIKNLASSFDDSNIYFRIASILEKKDFTFENLDFIANIFENKQISKENTKIICENIDLKAFDNYTNINNLRIFASTFIDNNLFDNYLYISEKLDRNDYSNTLIHYQFLARKKRYQSIIDDFERYQNNSNIPLFLIDYYINLLINTKNYRPLKKFLNTLLTNNSEIFKNYIDKYILSLQYTSSFDELFNFSTNFIENKQFRDNYGYLIFRIFFENKKTEFKDDYYNILLKYYDNEGIIYFNALNYLTNNNNREAFTTFLTLAYEYPGTYEGITSFYIIKTNKFNYSNEYYSYLYSNILNIDNFDTSRKIKFLKILKYEEPELFYKFLDDDKYNRIINNNFSNFITSYLNKTNFTITNISHILNSYLRYYNKEIFSYYFEQIKLNLEDKFIYYLQNKDIFIKIDLKGKFLWYVNFYINRLLGNRKHYFIFPDEFLKSLYPDCDILTIKNFTDNENFYLWVFSAYREESLFNKNVESIAGAYGYSQLMPKTANILKERMKKPEYNIYDFYDNISIGIYFMKELFRKYNGNIPRILAAYNAGETVVNKWNNSIKDIDLIWIEKIPYLETRNYIKKITSTRFYYQYLYNY